MFRRTVSSLISGSLLVAPDQSLKPLGPAGLKAVVTLEEDFLQACELLLHCTLAMPRVGQLNEKQTESFTYHSLYLL